MTSWPVGLRIGGPSNSFPSLPLETITPPSALYEKHERWITEVRDPAILASEGVRRIEVRNASAEYEIAHLPDGQWAMHTNLAFRAGDYEGSAMPWQTFSTREECVDTFLRRARKHFSRQIRDRDNEGESLSSQKKAGVEMMKRLDGDGLFGFIEPDPAR